MALDVGAKTIGLALSDASWRMALPVGTLRRGKFAADAAALARLMAQHAAEGLVVGWPLRMDGSVGPRAQSARDFATELRRALGGDPWIALVDERLTTAAALTALGGAHPRRAKARGALDALAAQAILESALSALIGPA